MPREKPIPSTWADLLTASKAYLGLHPKPCPELDKLQDAVLAVAEQELEEEKVALEAAYTRNR